VHNAKQLASLKKWVQFKEMRVAARAEALAALEAVEAGARAAIEAAEAEEARAALEAEEAGARAALEAEEAGARAALEAEEAGAQRVVARAESIEARTAEELEAFAKRNVELAEASAKRIEEIGQWISTQYPHLTQLSVEAIEKQVLFERAKLDAARAHLEKGKASLAIVQLGLDKERLNAGALTVKPDDEQNQAAVDKELEEAREQELAASIAERNTRNAVEELKEKLNAAFILAEKELQAIKDNPNATQEERKAAAVWDAIWDAINHGKEALEVIEAGARAILEIEEAVNRKIQMLVGAIQVSKFQSRFYESVMIYVVDPAKTIKNMKSELGYSCKNYSSAMSSVQNTQKVEARLLLSNMSNLCDFIEEREFIKFKTDVVSVLNKKIAEAKAEEEAQRKAEEEKRNTQRKAEEEERKAKNRAERRVNVTKGVEKLQNLSISNISSVLLEELVTIVNDNTLSDMWSKLLILTSEQDQPVSKEFREFKSCMQFDLISRINYCSEVEQDEINEFKIDVVSVLKKKIEEAKAAEAQRAAAEEAKAEEAVRVEAQRAAAEVAKAEEAAEAQRKEAARAAEVAKAQRVADERKAAEVAARVEAERVAAEVAKAEEAAEAQRKTEKRLAEAVARAEEKAAEEAAAKYRTVQALRLASQAREQAAGSQAAPTGAPLRPSLRRAPPPPPAGSQAPSGFLSTVNVFEYPAGATAPSGYKRDEDEGEFLAPLTIKTFVQGLEEKLEEKIKHREITSDFLCRLIYAIDQDGTFSNMIGRVNFVWCFSRENDFSSYIIDSGLRNAQSRGWEINDFKKVVLSVLKTGMYGILDEQLDLELLPLLREVKFSEPMLADMTDMVKMMNTVDMKADNPLQTMVGLLDEYGNIPHSIDSYIRGSFRGYQYGHSKERLLEIAYFRDAVVDMIKRELDAMRVAVQEELPKIKQELGSILQKSNLSPFAFRTIMDMIQYERTPEEMLHSLPVYIEKGCLHNEQYDEFKRIADNIITRCTAYIADGNMRALGVFKGIAEKMLDDAAVTASKPWAENVEKAAQEAVKEVQRLGLSLDYVGAIADIVETADTEDEDEDEDEEEYFEKSDEFNRVEECLKYYTVNCLYCYTGKGYDRNSSEVLSAEKILMREIVKAVAATKAVTPQVLAAAASQAPAAVDNAVTAAPPPPQALVTLAPPRPASKAPMTVAAGSQNVVVPATLMAAAADQEVAKIQLRVAYFRSLLRVLTHKVRAMAPQQAAAVTATPASKATPAAADQEVAKTQLRIAYFRSLLRVLTHKVRAMAPQQAVTVPTASQATPAAADQEVAPQVLAAAAAAPIASQVLAAAAAATSASQDQEAAPQQAAAAADQEVAKTQLRIAYFRSLLRVLTHKVRAMAPQQAVTATPAAADQETAKTQLRIAYFRSLLRVLTHKVRAMAPQQAAAAAATPADKEAAVMPSRGRFLQRTSESTSRPKP
jgi:hypothetical protein